MFLKKNGYETNEFYGFITVNKITNLKSFFYLCFSRKKQELHGFGNRKRSCKSD